MTGRLGAALRLLGFLSITLPLMPVQALLLRTHVRWAETFPHWYHKKVCRLLGIRLHIEGEITQAKPVLLVANHTSWLDIPVISAVAPVSFIAKSEVTGWPLVAQLAKLQRTVFVNRQRRSSVGRTANEILLRLERGDKIVLFAEGTSSDGNRVLPFKTSLFAAAKPTAGVGGEAAGEALVQTMVVAYTHLHGVPMGRAERARIVGWYGDMELVGHAWALLQAGPLDVHIRLGQPRPLDEFANRKQLAQQTETEVRETLVAMLRQGGHLVRKTGRDTLPPGETGGERPPD
jgi:1-acyl-sn-glycerol-3-phosphate acyltransferase